MVPGPGIAARSGGRLADSPNLRNIRVPPALNHCAGLPSFQHGAARSRAAVGPPRLTRSCAGGQPNGPSRRPRREVKSHWGAPDVTLVA